MRNSNGLKSPECDWKNLGQSGEKCSILENLREKKHHANVLKKTNSRCQFHQRFTYKFLVQMSFRQHRVWLWTHFCTKYELKYVDEIDSRCWIWQPFVVRPTNDSVSIIQHACHKCLLCIVGEIDSRLPLVTLANKHNNITYTYQLVLQARYAL